MTKSKIIYRADIVRDGANGEMKGEVVREFDFLTYIEEILKLTDKYPEAELWSCVRISKNGDFSITWKVLETIRAQKGQKYTARLNKVYAKKQEKR